MAHNTDEIRSKLEAARTTLTARQERVAKHTRNRQEPLPADFAEQAIELENGETLVALDQEMASEISHGGEPPEDVVTVALESLGGQPSVIPGWFNWLRANAAARLAPRGLVAHLARDVVEKQTPAEMR